MFWGRTALSANAEADQTDQTLGRVLDLHFISLIIFCLIYDLLPGTKKVVLNNFTLVWVTVDLKMARKMHLHQRC